jgi:hypothetical protein
VQLPMAEEAELSDEELLGEATLAKLASRTVLIKAEDEEVEVPFEIEEETEEAWVDELAEEAVEEVAEEEEAEE